MMLWPNCLAVRIKTGSLFRLRTPWLEDDLRQIELRCIEMPVLSRAIAFCVASSKLAHMKVVAQEAVDIYKLLRNFISNLFDHEA